MLPYVPGEVWARLVGQGEGATHLLASYLAMEVAALPRPLYAKVGWGIMLLELEELQRTYIACTNFIVL